jgi:hypothetical protein
MSDIVEEIMEDLKTVEVPKGYVSPYLKAESDIPVYGELVKREQKILVLMDRLNDEQKEAYEGSALAETDEESLRLKTKLARLSEKTQLLDKMLQFEVTDRLDMWDNGEDKPDLILLPDMTIGIVEDDGEDEMPFGMRVGSLGDLLGALVGEKSETPRTPGEEPCPGCGFYHD